MLYYSCNKEIDKKQHLEDEGLDSGWKAGEMTEDETAPESCSDKVRCCHIELKGDMTYVYAKYFQREFCR